MHQRRNVDKLACVRASYFRQAKFNENLRLRDQAVRLWRWPHADPRAAVWWGRQRRREEDVGALSSLQGRVPGDRPQAVWVELPGWRTAGICCLHIHSP